jgi:asparagine synthetase B (glutamine-hydrolysing)
VSTDIAASNLDLQVRSAVEFRTMEMPNGTLVYLSLLSDEIDDRLQRFVDRAAQLSREARSAESALSRAADRVELTDAVVIRLPAEIYVVRGAACSFPLFWQSTSTGLQLTTQLPIAGGVPLSQEGLLASYAAAALGGAYEPNGCVASPLTGWSRVRRGCVTRFDPASGVEEWPITFEPARPATEDEVASSVRAAFTSYGESQRRTRRAMVELSGGYDSTLAATFARSDRSELYGVSVHFPHYEFRLEEDVQQRAARAMGVSRDVIDGTTVFPYAPAGQWPRFDEPTTFVTGIRHAELVAEHARARGASLLYVGHGGDQLFSTDLTSSEPTGRPPHRAGLSPRARQTAAAIAAEHSSSWRGRSTGCFVYDGRQDIWAKERFGITVRSPFADLALFQAATRWSQWCAGQGRPPDKSILRRAVGDHLPAAVLDRHGKVAYDGVWARAYQQHAEHIARTLEAAAHAHERIGLDTAWLLGQARRLAELRPAAEEDVLAAYTLSTWLLSWDLVDADISPVEPASQTRSKKKFWNSLPSWSVRPK